ncbi:MAG: hypothetical protein EPN21_00955, partial [Methylococcaceae bacterium]
MVITNKQLFEIGDEIWTTMLGSGLVAGASQRWVEEIVFRTGCIAIDGSEKYALFIDSAEPLLCQLAAEFLGTFAGLVKDEELEDTLGEICNIAGGMVQHELAGPYQLGLPVISGCRHRSLTIPEG